VIRYLMVARALRPAEDHQYLAYILEGTGETNEVVSVWRGEVHRRPESIDARVGLGRALWAAGKTEEARPLLEAAVPDLRARIRDDPSDRGHAVRLLCDNVLYTLGRIDEADAAIREAIRLSPDDDTLHFFRGRRADCLNRFAEAEAEYREAIRLKPDSLSAHFHLGQVLKKTGDHEGAAVEYKHLVQSVPDDTILHTTLGETLVFCGRFPEALEELRRGTMRGSPRRGFSFSKATEDWIAECERFIALSPRVPALINGDDRPRDTAQCLDVAQMCFYTKRFRASARFWREALEADPKLGDDRTLEHRYSAACAAALAAAGKGKDEPKPDGAARAKLRGQALDWLMAERAAWEKTLDSGDARARRVVRQTLEHWQTDPHLAGVRDGDALAKLPEEERGVWRSLWAEVDALLARARGGRP
jgi:tetratricopeptide (TPR) repeat protein